MATKRRVRLPTRRRDWRLMGRTARLVVTVPAYGALAVVAAIAGLTLAVASLNPSLVSFALTNPGLSLADRVVLVVELYPFVGTAFDALQGVLLVLVAVLIGIDVAMLAYHLIEHGVSLRGGSTGAVGVLLGALGAGCAACGTVLLVGLLSLVGVTVSLTFLPLDGLEFALLAVVVLLVSIYWVAEGMRGGIVNGCPID